jgi:hypothetical protein
MPRTLVVAGVLWRTHDRSARRISCDDARVTQGDSFVLDVSRDGSLWLVRVRGTTWWTQAHDEADIEGMARDLIALNSSRDDTRDFDVEVVFVD